MSGSIYEITSNNTTSACQSDPLTKEDFQSALDAYQKEAADVKNLTEKNKVKQQDGKIVQKYLTQEYLSDYWLVVKKKWTGYIVKKAVNFGCNTTQRVEGSHAALEMNAVSSRSTLQNPFNGIDKYCTSKNKLCVKPMPWETKRLKLIASYKVTVP
ncbi:hypothetical protein PS15m_005399 [Mucor circinelloides]